MTMFQVMTHGSVRHSIVSDREIGSSGSTVHVPAAGDEPVILKIVHQRRNMPVLAYVKDIDG